MNTLPRHILDRGNTSLVPLRNVTPKNGTRILLKMESENPTGSMKDRMALAMIEAAEADGRLPANGPVVEYTTGSTGVSLSLVCGVKAHPLRIVTSDGIGAGFVVPLWRKEVVDQIAPAATDDALAMAMRLAQEEGLFAGTSTGANVVAALRVAQELGPEPTIVTVMCDTGMK